MALDQKLNVCVVCGNFRVTEATGTYNASTNPGGYGAPNQAFGDVTPYTVTFTAPKATSPTFVLDLYLNPPAPDADGHYTWSLLPEAFGMEVLKSGVWKVDIQFGAVLKESHYFARNDIEARIQKCICKDRDNIQMWVDLQGAIWQYRCFDYDEVQKTIDRLYRDTECCCGCGCS